MNLTFLQFKLVADATHCTLKLPQGLELTKCYIYINIYLLVIKSQKY